MLHRHRRLLRPRHERPRDRRAAEQRDELAASHMPFKPWDRDIAPERYHIQTLRLIRICVLLGSDAIRCLIGMGLSAAVRSASRLGAKKGRFLTAVVGPARCGSGSTADERSSAVHAGLKLRNT